MILLEHLSLSSQDIIRIKKGLIKVNTLVILSLDLTIKRIIFSQFNIALDQQWH